MTEETKRHANVSCNATEGLVHLRPVRKHVRGGATINTQKQKKKKPGWQSGSSRMCCRERQDDMNKVTEMLLLIVFSSRDRMFFVNFFLPR